VLNELGLAHEVEKVDLAAKKTEKGADYWQINPKGYVPAIATDDGQLVTEAANVLQYLADKKPEANLLPKPGTMERTRAVEWLTFISTELHKGYSPLFRPTTPDAYKTIVREKDVYKRQIQHHDAQSVGPEPRLQLDRKGILGHQAVARGQRIAEGEQPRRRWRIGGRCRRRAR